MKKLLGIAMGLIGCGGVLLLFSLCAGFIGLIGSVQPPSTMPSNKPSATPVVSAPQSDLPPSDEVIKPEEPTIVLDEPTVDTPNDPSPAPPLPTTTPTRNPVLENKIDPALMQLVFTSLEKNRSAQQLVSGNSSSLKVGSFVHLTESAEVMGIVGTDMVQVMFKDSNDICFVKGMSLNGIVSGKSYDFGLVKVEGVQQYSTILGSTRASFVLDVVSGYEWNEAVAAAKELNVMEAKSNLETEAAELQIKIAGIPVDEWSDKSGSFKTHATYVSATAETVTLRKSDGKEVTVPRARLSKESEALVSKRSGDLSRWRARAKQIENLLNR
jgi:hypothetical protein